MLVYQNVSFVKNTKTGKINVTCNEDFNFDIEAYGKLPRRKDLIKAINRLYDQIEKHENGWEKLKTHKIIIESNSMMGRGKTKKSKNMKSVWSNKPGESREQFYSQLFKN